MAKKKKKPTAKALPARRRRTKRRTIADRKAELEAELDKLDDLEADGETFLPATMDRPAGGNALAVLDQGILDGGSALVKLDSASGIEFERIAGTVKSVDVDAEGNVIKTTMEPEQWPPKRSAGETF
jgi:hypothetical protein